MTPAHRLLDDSVPSSPLDFSSLTSLTSNWTVGFRCVELARPALTRTGGIKSHLTFTGLRLERWPWRHSMVWTIISQRQTALTPWIRHLSAELINPERGRMASASVPRDRHWEEGILGQSHVGLGCSFLSELAGIWQQPPDTDMNQCPLFICVCVWYGFVYSQCTYSTYADMSIFFFFHWNILFLLLLFPSH